MGLLDIFKRKDKKKSPNISFEIKMTDANGNEIDADSEEYLREREERERRRAEDEARRAELQEANRQFLLDSGVDVNLPRRRHLPKADAGGSARGAGPPRGLPLRERR